MFSIRKNCFETNSSSTHAICIPPKGNLGQCLFTFHTDCYGWERGEADPCNYLYTAICELYESDDQERQKILNHIKTVCEKNHCKCEFVEPVWKCSSYNDKKYLDPDSGYIDHCGELRPFVEELISNEELLVRYLSGASVFTGNDNDYDFGRIDEVVEEYTNKGYYVYEKDN